MKKTGKQIDVFGILAKRFPELFRTLEKEGKLREFGIRELEIYAIYSLLKRNLLSTALVLFLGFSHGDSYPVSSISAFLKGVDLEQITEALQNLKTKGFVYVEKFGVNWDFYALDRRFLSSAISNFKQKKLDQIEPNKRNIESLYDNLKLCPRIRKVSESLFKTGHYAQAIFEAFKCIEVMIKEKSGIDNQDGQTLMAHVFNETRPILRINPLQTTSDRDEQTGFKLIFMGVMTGIRNPKAHDIIRQKDPYRTLEYLQLASLLARRIDEAMRP